MRNPDLIQGRITPCGSTRTVLYLCLFFLCVLIPGRLFAAPYFGESFTYQQPDGESFEVKLYGDEFFAYAETVNGYLITRDPENGFFCYGNVAPDGLKVVSTGVRVGQAIPAGLKTKQRLARGVAMGESIEKRNLLGKDAKGRRNEGKKLVQETSGEIRSVALDGGEAGSGDSGVIAAPAPPPAPTLNKRVGLVLLASFPDRPADITKTVADIDDYCNAETYTAGGNATSIYGYFHIQSNGKLNYKNNVTAWFTAANPRSYYTDNTIAYATRARELIREGLTVLKAQGFDFTKCDGNGDGKLDGVNMFYAGARVNAWSEGLWPHQSSSSWTGLTGTGLSSISYDYQITDMPSSLPIGTFCHENGHMICDFPDLYSYDNNAANLGAFSLMHSSGSTHPRHVDPYLKIHAGWADVVDLTSASVLQCAVQQDRNFFYRYRNPGKSTEYFLFEVRGTAGYEGAWGGAGATNPANGLVVYHANQTGSNTSSSIFTRANPPTTTLSYTTPYEIMVVEATPATLANGDPWYTAPNPTSNDSFSSAGVSSITDSTTPELKFWAADGRTAVSGANINTISAAGATMTFKAGSGSLPATPVTNVTATQLGPTVDYGQNAANQTFAVFNSAGGTLSYSITDNVAWLSCSPTSGSVTTSASTITVTYTTSALAAGTHNATITIDGGSGGIKTIPVTLTVNAQPTLTAFPTSISKTGNAGTSNNTSNFYVGNSGGGSASYTITKTQTWLTLDRTSGIVAGEQDLITATMNATSLSPGVYNDTITVTSATATNSPLTIPVTFTVLSTDMIVTSPNGNEQWTKGDAKTITWVSTLGGTVKIELFKGGVFHSTIIASTANTGSYNWTIPGTPTAAADYRVTITSIETPAKTDTSDANFSILGSLAEALDTSGLTWTPSGNLPWFAQTTTKHDGVDAAQSGAIADSQSSSMETTLTGPGTLTFWWNVSSESGYDYLRFYLNGVEQAGAVAISGTGTWAQKTISIPAGSQTVKWTYSKDSSVASGSDTAWVDEVVYTPTSSPEIVVEQPVGTDLTDGSATINLGSVNTGSSSSAFSFTVRNTGTVNLTGLAITKDGTHNADYAVSALGATTLAPAASTTFTVTFSPGAAGARTAAIHIASNDANENPFDINLTGTGVGPGTLSVTAGDFASSGNYGGAFAPASKVYTLSNPGGTSINWTAAKTAAWVDLSATSGTLAAGANTTVTASIHSNANSLNAGGYSDTVTFTNTTSGSGNTTRAVDLTVNPAPASVILGNLSQYHDGIQKTVSVTTSPVGLAHSVTYNGSGTAPTNAGTYAVVATVTNPNYTGSASGDLVIGYRVNYLGNGNTSGSVPADQMKLQSVDLALASNSGSLSRTGYTFIGWNSAADGSGTSYGIGATYSANAALTLYARWVVGTYLTWDANGASANQTNGAGAWTGANLWWNGTANQSWASGAIATFGGLNTAGGAVTLASPTVVESLTFNQFTGTYTLGTSGQTITLNNGINKTSAAAAVTFASPIELGGTQTWTNNSSGNLLFGNGTNLITTNGYQLTIDGSGTTTLGVINNAGVTLSGTGSLIKNGSGRFNVGGLNSGFSGNVTINSGVLHAYNDAGVLGSGNLTLNGGVFSFYWGTTYTRALGASASQVQILGGESGFGGAGTSGPTINLGTTLVWGAVGEGAATGYFNPSKFVLGDAGTTNAGVLTFSSGINLNGATRTIVVPKGLSAGYNQTTISAAISNSAGTGSLIKEGDGMLFLTVAPTYNGTTTISQGFVDFAALNLNSMGGGAGVRSISVAAGAIVKRNTLDNAFLNRLVETTDEFTVMTGTTANNLNFASSTGANLPNAFLGNWASNGAKCEYSGTITPASDAYRLGGKGGSGLLGIVGTNKLTGTQGLLVGTTTGGGRVELAAANNFSGHTIIRTGARLTLGNNLALQNSPLNLGSAGGTFSLSDGLNAARITGGVAAPSPTFGGLVGSRNLLAAFSGASGGNNESVLLASAVTGFTLNPGTGVTCDYSGAIADFATGTTLVKTGPGTQILSGASTYTGTTTVSEGTLLINGSLSNLAVSLSVASGAKLGGSGTIGRNVTIANGGELVFDISTNAASHNSLDLSAGRDFSFSGTSALTITSAGGASPGTYTLITGGNNLAGAAPATLHLPVGWEATVSISGNSLLLNVTSTTGGSYTLSYAAGSGGSLTGNTSQTVSYGASGTAVTAVPNAGYYFVKWSDDVMTAVRTDTNIMANLSVTANFARISFTSWAGGTFANGALGNQDMSVDFDGDGLASGLEWVFGGDPTLASDAEAEKPVFDNTTDGTYAIYSFRRTDLAKDDPSTAIVVEYGSTLTGWSTAIHDGDNIVITETNDGFGAGVDKVEVKIKRSTMAPGGKIFTRIRVVVSP